MTDTNQPATTKSNAPVAVDVTPLSDRYVIEQEIGRGGMGLVYRGRHRHLDTQVAIKRLLPGIDRERFLREAQLLAKAKSPHVVMVYEFEILPDDSALLVMEFLDGESLDKLIKRRGILPEEEVLPWMRQTALALETVSELGIVHRDVKPSNIQIDGKGQVKLMDFGLARSDFFSLALTHSGTHLGSPYYMSPEQAEDPRSVDVRADIYSFGAAYYHALTGKPPFEGATAFGVMYKHKTEPLVAARSVNPELSSTVAQVLERCLAKSPSSRFNSFEEIVGCLSPAQNPALTWHTGIERADSAQFVQFQSRKGHYLRRELKPGDVDVYEFSTNRSLRVVVGDICREQAEVIVSSDNAYLTMEFGCSLAIARAAGPEVEAMARRFAPVLPGRIVVTPAGALNGRFIFHAVTNGFVNEPLRATRDIIAELVSAVFYHADTLSVQSIALPLLGAGGARLAEEDSLEALFLSVARHLERGVTSVREVKLVLYPHPRAS